MKQFFVAAFCALMLNLSACAQPDTAIKPVGIGSRVPDISLMLLCGGKLIAKPVSALYKGRLLILDFWATWCSPCVSFFGASDSLNRIFAGKIEILPVTYQDRGTVTAFFLRTFGENAGRYRTVILDSVLSSCFPHKIIPHEVWIDSNGIVRFITNSESVNRENIDKFLGGLPLPIRQKKEKMDFDSQKLFEVVNDDIVYRSVFTGYNEAIGGGLAVFPGGLQYDKKRQRAFFWNTGLVNMFYTAFIRHSPYPAQVNMKKIELHVRDSGMIREPLVNHDQWMRENTFCYELTLPRPVEAKLFWKYIFDDLNRVSPLRASVQKRRKPCWILKVCNPALLKRGEGDPLTKSEYLTVKKILNQKIGTLAAYLNALQGIDPVVDETGIVYPVNLDLDMDISNKYRIENIRALLRKNGLSLSRGKRLVDILVMEEK
jgi:thiol-disulfide isomerase/thioredoxin